jgi:hypothetical protein
MWRHPLETGVLPDLPPTPLDVVDLLTRPVPRREGRVDVGVLPRAPTTAEILESLAPKQADEQS